jgi:ADP-ribose pyrophosphatase
VAPGPLEKLLGVIAANEDALDTETCLGHGDLNLANIICDEGDNIWFIDWTHCARQPLELDFAKLESDIKFVISKDFDADDLPRLRQLEEYLSAQRIPAGPGGLPDALKFAKWDLRFRKILEAVRRVREACFALKGGDDWLVYRIALLRYALHTLSFDKRRGRGECDPPQLMHALYAVEGLMHDLVADDYPLRIRGERPDSYPARQRISIDEAPWALECPGYDPPYHVDPSVLANDRTTVDGGWADPEPVELVKDEPRVRDAKRHDETGRPLNPRGRAGLAGRGVLGLWGPNLSVAPTVVRTNEGTGQPEILLGNTDAGQSLELPKGFVLPGEAPQAAVSRVLEAETGWHPDEGSGEVVFGGYTYDPRQTDHAWVESQVFLILVGSDLRRGRFRPGGKFDEIKWWPLEEKTVNRVPSGQARFIRETVTRLVEKGRIEQALAEGLLAATG